MKIEHQIILVGLGSFGVAVFLTVMLFVIPPFDTWTKIMAYLMITSFYLIGSIFIWCAYTDRKIRKSLV